MIYMESKVRALYFLFFMKYNTFFVLRSEDKVCTNCKGPLVKFGTVDRYIKTRYCKREKTNLQRYRCKNCGMVHRMIPDYILPYKQYEADVINGVREGLITASTKGFEDYPTELTMKRWSTSYVHPHKA